MEELLSHMADYETYLYIHLFLTFISLQHLEHAESHRATTKGVKLVFKLAAHCANALPLCLAGFTLDLK